MLRKENSTGSEQEELYNISGNNSKGSEQNAVVRNLFKKQQTLNQSSGSGLGLKGFAVNQPTLAQ